MTNYFEENDDYYNQNIFTLENIKNSSLKDDLDNSIKDIQNSEDYTRINAYSKIIGHVEK